MALIAQYIRATDLAAPWLTQKIFMRSA